MNRAEFWLLDSVVEWRFPIDILEWEDMEACLNKKGHGLSHDELVKVLHRLFQDGSINVQRYDDQQDAIGVEFCPALEEIEAALRHEVHIEYGLTQQGGARWEEAAKPNWDRFLTEWSRTDPNETEATIINRALLEKYMDFKRGCGSVVEGTGIWDILAPWDATYWKAFPLAYRVRYEYVRRDDNWERTEAWFRFQEEQLVLSFT